MSESYLCIVTGASRGFGEAIAIELTKGILRLQSNCNNNTNTNTNTNTNDNDGCNIKKIHMCLVARSCQGLQNTQQQIQQTLVSTTTTTEWNVSIHEMDLSNMITLEQEWKKMISSLLLPKQEYYDHVILIHNAGTLGYVGRIGQQETNDSNNNTLYLSSICQSIQLNITSMIWMTHDLIQTFTRQNNNNKNTKITIVNVSSLCAKEAFPTMALYCTMKAARDMFLMTLAKEYNTSSSSSSQQQQDNVVQVWNYAPGALKTDMTINDLLQPPNYHRLDSSLQSYYNELQSQQTWISPQQSAQTFVQHVLFPSKKNNNNFPSGSHIDYWDLQPPTNNKGENQTTNDPYDKHKK